MIGKTGGGSLEGDNLHYTPYSWINCSCMDCTPNLVQQCYHSLSPKQCNNYVWLYILHCHDVFLQGFVANALDLMFED
jgi:hypothetical protein